MTSNLFSASRFALMIALALAFASRVEAQFVNSAWPDASETVYWVVGHSAGVGNVVYQVRSSTGECQSTRLSYSKWSLGGGSGTDLMYVVKPGYSRTICNVTLTAAIPPGSLSSNIEFRGGDGTDFIVAGTFGTIYGGLGADVILTYGAVVNRKNGVVDTTGDVYLFYGYYQSPFETQATWVQGGNGDDMFCDLGGHAGFRILLDPGGGFDTYWNPVGSGVVPTGNSNWEAIARAGDQRCSSTLNLLVMLGMT